MQGESGAAALTMRCRETAAEQQTVLHQRDTARLQRELAASASGRLSAPALLTFMRDIYRSRSAMATALHVSGFAPSSSLFLPTICGAAACMC